MCDTKTANGFFCITTKARRGEAVAYAVLFSILLLIMKTQSRLPDFASSGFEAQELLKVARELEVERAEAIEIARTAIGAIETIYGHAQFCDQCQSFEIAKQCLDELHGFDRLNSLENMKLDNGESEERTNGINRSA